MINITAGDILAELDNAVFQTRKEKVEVIAGRIYNPAHHNQVEYLYFLESAEKAFVGMRQYLRSEDFVQKVSARKSKEINTDER